MKIILLALYSCAAAIALFSGWIYPQAQQWSHFPAGSFALYLALAVAVACCPVLAGGRIAAWAWQGLSSLASAGALFAYCQNHSKPWLLAAFALAVLTSLLTLVICLVLKTGGVADIPHGKHHDAQSCGDGACSPQSEVAQESPCAKN